MAEKPISFMTEMVQALLAGRKTETRRLVEPQPPAWAQKAGPCIGIWCSFEGLHPADTCEHEKCACIGASRITEPFPSIFTVRSAYAVGDILWVREPHVRFTGCSLWPDLPWIMPPEGKVYHARLPIADNQDAVAKLREAGACVTVSNIFLPRWAARIFLRVTRLRVERVQEITEEDAIAEGFPGDCCYRRPGMVGLVTDDGTLPEEQFREVWDGRYAERGLGWVANPFVWVYEFERREECKI